MGPELSSFIERREQRLLLMRQMAALLERAQTCLVSSDLKGLDASTQGQVPVCKALQELDAQSVCAPRRATLAELLDSAVEKHDIAVEVEERWTALEEELEKIEARVRYLGRLHAGLLKKARHTVGIFVRLMQNSASTYVPPSYEATMVEFGVEK